MVGLSGNHGDAADPELAPPPHRLAGQDRRLAGFLLTLSVVVAVPMLLLILIVWGRLQQVELGWFAAFTASFGLSGLLAVVLGLLIVSVLGIAFLPWRWARVYMPVTASIMQAVLAVWLVAALVPPLLPPLPPPPSPAQSPSPAEDVE